MNSGPTGGFQTRDALLYVPDADPGARELPLVFNWHGFGTNAGSQRTFSEMSPLAEAEGFMVICKELACPPSPHTHMYTHTHQAFLKDPPGTRVPTAFGNGVRSFDRVRPRRAVCYALVDVWAADPDGWGDLKSHNGGACCSPANDIPNDDVGTSTFGNLFFISTALSRVCVGTRRRKMLPCPVCAQIWPMSC